MFHASGNIAVYRWARFGVRRLAARLDARVAVSPAAAGMAEHYLGGHYDVLFNGIETDRFADAAPADREGAHLDVYCLGFDPVRYDMAPFGAAPMLSISGATEAHGDGLKTTVFIS